MLNYALFRLFFNLLVSLFPNYLIQLSLSFSNQALRIFLQIMNRIHLNLNAFLQLNARNGNQHIFHRLSIDSFIFVEHFGLFLIEEFHLDAGPIDNGLEVIFNRNVILLLICEVFLF